MRTEPFGRKTELFESDKVTIITWFPCWLSSNINPKWRLLLRFKIPPAWYDGKQLMRSQSETYIFKFLWHKVIYCGAWSTLSMYDNACINDHFRHSPQPLWGRQTRGIYHGLVAFCVFWNNVWREFVRTLLPAQAYLFTQYFHGSRYHGQNQRPQESRTYSRYSES